MYAYVYINVYELEDHRQTPPGRGIRTSQGAYIYICIRIYVLFFFCKYVYVYMYSIYVYVYVNMNMNWWIISVLFT
jgi:hypothetical protein